MSNKSRLKRGLVLLLGILMLFCLFAAGCGGGAKVKPLSQTAEGIYPNTSFQIKAGGKVSAEELRQRISLDPVIPFSLSSNQDGSFTLIPQKAFAPGQTVTLMIKDSPDSEKGKEFTFTVNNTLMVLSSFPADQGKNVNIRSGVDIELNCEEISLSNFQDAFSISPNVGGDFYQSGYHYVFSPVELFSYNTTYTVTLDAEKLSKSSGLNMESSLTFSFTTLSEEESVNEYVFYPTSASALNVRPDQAPMPLFHIDRDIAAELPAIQVDLFEMDFEQYQEQLESVSQQRFNEFYTLSVDGLKSTLSFEAHPTNIESSQTGYYNANYGILFPETLPKGWYAARFTLQNQGSDVTRYLLIQSTDISVFTMSLGNKNTDMLAWINDLETGQPLENAKIKLSGNIFGEGTSSVDGTARIPLHISYTEEESSYNRCNNILTVSVGDKVYADILPISSDISDNEANQYITYLYTDREIYRTTDTIRVWGVARPRYADSPAVKDLTLDFANGTVQQTVTPGPDGTFTAEISYENLTSQYWENLKLLKDDVILSTHGISIQDYVKPVYTASVSSSKPVYMLENDKKMDISLDVSTFDGTPASGFQMQMRSAWGSGGVVSDPRNLISDQNGHIDSYVTVSESLDTWRPASYDCQFVNTQSENETFYVHGTMIGIHRNLMLTGSLTAGKDTASVEVNTNKITLSRIKGPNDVWDYENLKGEAISRPVKASVHKRYFEKVEIGTYYNYILRETLPEYEYVEKDEIIDTYTFETTNGKYVLNNLPLSNPEETVSYYLELSATDTKGNPVIENIYLGENIYSRSSRQDNQYTFERASENSYLNYNSIEDRYANSHYHSYNGTFQENEDVSFTLALGGKKISQLDGRLLYVTVQENFNDIVITEDPSFALKYDPKMMPNYLLAGVYFDGKQFHMVENLDMYFDVDSRRLDIQLTPDKDSYQPSGQVKVTAAVTDHNTGKPVSNAAILLSVVDEAVFAVQEQFVDFAQSLHSSIYYSYIQTYNSTLESNPATGGGKGGGDGAGSFRYKFLDTAQFLTAVTDASGKAVFQFELPDNLTEWRLTSLALQGNYAGNTKTGIKATQPFFVQPVLNSTILTGDTLSIGLRSAGTDIDPSDAVNYRVTVEGDNGYKKTLIKTNPAGEYTCVDTQGLKSGEYTATISGEVKNLSDSIRLPFSVVDSGIEISLVKNFDLKEPISIDSLRYPVSLSIYNQDAQLYHQAIDYLIYNNYASRTDFRIANHYIANLYREQGNDWYDEKALEDSLGDVTETFLRLFPYDNLNTELTAKAFLAAPDIISPNQDTNYLQEYKSLDVQGRASAVYLAEAVKNPDIKNQVLKNLKTADEQGLDFADKMYLTTALAVCGDTKTAEKYYNQWVTPVLKEITGVSGDKALYVDIKDSHDTFMTNTAAASMAASVLDKKDAEGLILYMISTQSDKEAYPLELLIFMEHYSPDTSSKAEFSYVLDGKTMTETLKGSEAKYLTMTKEQLAHADFKVLSGNVSANVFYWGTPSSRQESANQLIGLTKTIEPVDGSFKVGGLMKITITPDFSKLDTSVGNAALVVNDYIPSGMRYVSFANEDYGYGWYVDNRQEQRITFNIFNADLEGGVAPLVYYVRCTTPGDYINESAYISSAFGDVWGSSPRSVVHIQE